MNDYDPNDREAEWQADQDMNREIDRLATSKTGPTTPMVSRAELDALRKRYDNLARIIHVESQEDDHNAAYSPEWAVVQMGLKWEGASEQVERLEAELARVTAERDAAVRAPGLRAGTTRRCATRCGPRSATRRTSSTPERTSRTSSSTSWRNAAPPPPLSPSLHRTLVPDDQNPSETPEQAAACVLAAVANVRRVGRARRQSCAPSWPPLRWPSTAPVSAYPTRNSTPYSVT